MSRAITLYQDGERSVVLQVFPTGQSSLVVTPDLGEDVIVSELTKQDLLEMIAQLALVAVEMPS
jgi:hypothetical protein